VGTAAGLEPVSLPTGNRSPDLPARSESLLRRESGSYVRFIGTSFSKRLNGEEKMEGTELHKFLKDLGATSNLQVSEK
jgi:hypothetical protein